MAKTNVCPRDIVRYCKRGSDAAGRSGHRAPCDKCRAFAVDKDCLARDRRRRVPCEVGYTGPARAWKPKRVSKVKMPHGGDAQIGGGSSSPTKPPAGQVATTAARRAVLPRPAPDTLAAECRAFCMGSMECAECAAHKNAKCILMKGYPECVNIPIDREYKGPSRPKAARRLLDEAKRKKIERATGAWNRRAAPSAPRTVAETAIAECRAQMIGDTSECAQCKLSAPVNGGCLGRDRLGVVPRAETWIGFKDRRAEQARAALAMPKGEGGEHAS